MSHEILSAAAVRAYRALAQEARVACSDLSLPGGIRCALGRALFRLPPVEQDRVERPTAVALGDAAPSCASDDVHGPCADGGGEG